eukprot:scaffold63079_cov56-Phaeocystis_antarctica.AAC.5
MSASSGRLGRHQELPVDIPREVAHEHLSQWPPTVKQGHAVRLKEEGRGRTTQGSPPMVLLVCERRHRDATIGAWGG